LRCDGTAAGPCRYIEEILQSKLRNDHGRGRRIRRRRCALSISSAHQLTAVIVRGAQTVSVIGIARRLAMRSSESLFSERNHGNENVISNF
jgi:hypothetical protein